MEYFGIFIVIYGC